MYLLGYYLLQYRNEPNVIEISSSQESDYSVEEVDARHHDDSGEGSSTDFQSTQALENTSTLEQHGLSSSGSSSERPDLDNLISMFEHLNPKQISTIYLLSGNSFDRTLQCLLEGPSLQSIITILNCYFESKPTVKVDLDLSTCWEDLLEHYKSSKADCNTRIRIALAGSLTIDTGGIRRQIYTQVYAEFAKNKHIYLFDGEPNMLRPAISAIARSSGILKILGKMLSHSIFQDGIGFPYLSHVCFWYLIGNENMAIEHVSLADLPADSASFIKEVM